jgi:hypothetical protein
MGRLPRPKTKLTSIPVEFREMDCGFTSQILIDAGCYRLTVPRREVKMWDIMPGDEVAVKITRLKREPVN